MLSTADTCTTRFTAYQRCSPSCRTLLNGAMGAVLMWLCSICSAAAEILNPYELGVGVGSAFEAAAAAYTASALRLLQRQQHPQPGP